MRTEIGVLVIIAGAVVWAWMTSWPNVAGWGRTAAADRRRGRALGDLVSVGIELPKTADDAMQTMVGAWPTLIRGHDRGKPLIFDHLFTGTDEGARLDVILRSSDLDRDKKALADAFGGSTTFYKLAGDPVEDLSVRLTIGDEDEGSEIQPSS